MRRLDRWRKENRFVTMSLHVEPVESFTLPPVGSPQELPTRKMTVATWLARSRGWLSLVVLAPSAVVAAFSPLRYGPGTWSCFLLESAAWLLFLVGGMMRWWGTLYIGGRKSYELISAGPYSITRNPIYCGTFLLTLSVAVMAQSVVFLLAVMVVSAAYLFFTVPDEEDALRAIYGESFQAYCRRVPRFIPRCSLFHSPEAVQVHVVGLWAESVRMCRWAWIPFLCNLLVHLRSESWWPIWFSLP
jgi:protein-S-isoprenylcysteine O-methyltransferase Ste14